ncbi:dehydrogenase/reductase SDR family member 7B isoform X4 [Antechinus flavipes]|uniref:dehydrogenase/reductase SDR family member 7B isoform X4 n=1 Tax=Antechinus flavipes TaxID=38775 RepID=UPI0022354399|nr:dehydrogenase/reductase SDR family member 7B isoform X4 [Antechinus flavipes]
MKRNLFGEICRCLVIYSFFFFSFFLFFFWLRQLGLNDLLRVTQLGTVKCLRSHLNSDPPDYRVGTVFTAPPSCSITHRPHIVVFDLADSDTIVPAANEILQYTGYVDILINNAGISYRGTIMDTALEVDKKVMETNYFGPVALTKAILPSMIAKKQGHIVVISSIQGKISIPFRSAYAASKHATQAFFDCLRAEMQQHEIDVTVICPGYIQTNLSLNALTADGSKYGVMDKNTASGRSPAEVAQTVLTAVGKKKKEVMVADMLPCLAVSLRTLSPRLFFYIMAMRAKKERKAKDS